MPPFPLVSPPEAPPAEVFFDQLLYPFRETYRNAGHVVAVILILFAIEVRFSADSDIVRRRKKQSASVGG
jgi:hypothetical protein